MLKLTEVAANESTCDGRSEIDDGNYFKARLIAVLLEYGDKGLDLRCVLYVCLFLFIPWALIPVSLFV
jgi:hypothetical protein